MFTPTANVMLYVDDVAAEKTFWKAIGFEITAESEIMGYQTFDMKISDQSTAVFTVFDLAFIRQNSPEVADNQPSLLFETEDLEGLHALVSQHAKTTTPISEVPFKHFAMQAPSGQYYAVRGI